jgi:hypothetical protein
MYDHLFDKALTETELASYQPCSGYHNFYISLSFNRKVGASKTIASMYKVPYLKEGVTLKPYIQAFI